MCERERIFLRIATLILAHVSKLRINLAGILINLTDYNTDCRVCKFEFSEVQIIKQKLTNSQNRFLKEE